MTSITTSLYLIAVCLWTLCRSTLKAKFRTDKRCEESSCRDRRCGWEQVPPTIKLSKFPCSWNIMEMIEMLCDDLVMLGEISHANSAWQVEHCSRWRRGAGASSKPSNPQCVSQLSFPVELEKNQIYFPNFFSLTEKLTQKKAPTGGASGPGGDRPRGLALPPCAGGPVPRTTEERRKRPGPGAEPWSRLSVCVERVETS